MLECRERGIDFRRAGGLKHVRTEDTHTHTEGPHKQATSAAAEASRSCRFTDDWLLLLI